MKTRVIVPMKPLLASKSRLRGALPDEQRATLALGMLNHVLGILGDIRDADVVVAGGDPAVRSLCDRHGALWRADEGQDLNRCLGREFALGQHEGAECLAFLPADLPIVTRRDIETFIERAASARAVIVPDRHDAGTNGLLVRRECAIQFRLGENSFRTHSESLTGLGIAHVVLRLPGLELDLDTREDLVVLEQRSPGRAAELLREGASALARAPEDSLPTRTVP